MFHVSPEPRTDIVRSYGVEERGLAQAQRGYTSMLVAQVIGLALVLVLNPGDSAYSKAHATVLIASLLAIAAFFTFGRSVVVMLRSTGTAIKRLRKIGREETLDAMMVASLAIGILSIALVDLSFASSGLQIGGAAAVSVAVAIKAMWKHWRQQ